MNEKVGESECSNENAPSNSHSSTFEQQKVTFVRTIQQTFLSFLFVTFVYGLSGKNDNYDQVEFAQTSRLPRQLYHHNVFCHPNHNNNNGRSLTSCFLVYLGDAQPGPCSIKFAHQLLLIINLMRTCSFSSPPFLALISDSFVPLY